jgi:hypothetical protein
VKATLRDIAAAAGVGTATVERVLNGRGGVAPRTDEKVLVAARRLDYPKRLPEMHRGLLRIEVILVRPETTFFARLSRSFERIAATLDSSVGELRRQPDSARPLVRYVPRWIESGRRADAGTPRREEGEIESEGYGVIGQQGFVACA